MSQFSTQQSIQIAGIKDGVVILKDGGYRLILSVSTVNFALKSEQEQNSLIFQYQSFLNSLHFPIEIVMRSRRMDLTPYLRKVAALLEKQSNELLRIQTQDYIEFVGKLVNIANIMKKNFFVAVPYQPITLQSAGFFQKMFKKEKTYTELRISESEFKHNSDELRQRANIVASGLGSMGLHCVQLNTEEIIELFYQIYNPEEAVTERITDAANLTSPIIEQATGAEQSVPLGTPQEEVVIDNRAAVEEKQKEEIMRRQQELDREGTKQIATTGATAKSDATPSTPPASSPANPVNPPSPTTSPNPPGPDVNPPVSGQ